MIFLENLWLLYIPSLILVLIICKGNLKSFIYGIIWELGPLFGLWTVRMDFYKFSVIPAAIILIVWVILVAIHHIVNRMSFGIVLGDIATILFGIGAYWYWGTYTHLNHRYTMICTLCVVAMISVALYAREHGALKRKIERAIILFARKC